MKYECHVTLDGRVLLSLVKEVADRHKFHCSWIVGDELLGSAKHLYCTRSGEDSNELALSMDHLIDDLQTVVGTSLILRKKIEQVIFDVRLYRSDPSNSTRSRCPG